MKEIQLHRLDMNLLIVFQFLMDEGSVAAAADKLGKTPSAVSHALARLRDQVGDPLLVKVGGRMQPSPFALQLIRDIRPILRQIERVIAPPRHFEAATSTRRFRIAVPSIPTLISEVFSRVNREAPTVALEWVGLGPHLYKAVAEEEVDLALLAVDEDLPEGLVGKVMPPLERFTFMRKDHPAADALDRAAWLAYPHVVVGMSNAARQTVEDQVARDGLDRRIGAHLPEFSGVAPLLARTDMLGTSPRLFMIEGLEIYGLVARKPPVSLPDITFRFFWSARLSQDPGCLWLRSVVIGAYEAVLARAALPPDDIAT